MLVFSLGLEFERAEETHHRREALLVVLHVFCLDGIGTAERQQAFEFAAVGAGDLIEQIPGADAERLAFIEVVVQCRRLIASKPEQALVDHRQGVGHGAAIALAHLNHDIRLRRPFLGRVHHRTQARLGIVDLERDDAVQADRTIVVLAGVRLYERDAHVHVRAHALGDGHVEAGVILAEFDPALVEDARAAFQRHQGAALGGLG